MIIDQSLVGRSIRLLMQTRGVDGKPHSRNEVLVIKSRTISLGRELFMVQFEDQTSCFLFREEFELIDTDT